MISFKVTEFLSDGLQLGGFCLVVELRRARNSTNQVSPSSLIGYWYLTWLSGHPNVWSFSITTKVIVHE